MAAYADCALPFHQVGNRRFLTEQQLCEWPWLEEFVARFGDSFEHDAIREIWLFNEPDNSKGCET